MLNYAPSCLYSLAIYTGCLLYTHKARVSYLRKNSTSQPYRKTPSFFQAYLLLDRSRHTTSVCRHKICICDFSAERYLIAYCGNSLQEREIWKYRTVITLLFWSFLTFLFVFFQFCRSKEDCFFFLAIGRKFSTKFRPFFGRSRSGSASGNARSVILFEFNRLMYITLSKCFTESSAVTRCSYKYLGKFLHTIVNRYCGLIIVS